jgi:hypothetical protein
VLEVIVVVVVADVVGVSDEVVVVDGTSVVGIVESFNLGITVRYCYSST